QERGVQALPDGHHLGVSLPVARARAAGKLRFIQDDAVRRKEMNQLVDGTSGPRIGQRNIFQWCDDNGATGADRIRRGKEGLNIQTALLLKSANLQSAPNRSPARDQQLALRIFFGDVAAADRIIRPARNQIEANHAFAAALAALAARLL